MQNAVLAHTAFEFGGDPFFLTFRKVRAVGNIEKDGDPRVDLVNILAAGSAGATENKPQLVLTDHNIISNLYHRSDPRYL